MELVVLFLILVGALLFCAGLHAAAVIGRAASSKRLATVGGGVLASGSLVASVLLLSPALQPRAGRAFGLDPDNAILVMVVIFITGAARLVAVGLDGVYAKRRSDWLAL